MPRPSSTPSIIIPLVYVILELRRTQNKQRFCLKASGFPVGVSVEGSEGEEGTGFTGDAVKRDVSNKRDLLRVYEFSPFCLYHLLNQPSNTHMNTHIGYRADAKCDSKDSQAFLSWIFATEGVKLVQKKKKVDCYHAKIAD